MAVHVRIEPPVRDFLAALKEAPDRLDLAVKKRFRALAQETADDARSAAAGAHPPTSIPRTRNHQPQHWQDLVETIRSGTSGNATFVSLGDAGVPWVLGSEFGSLGGPGKAQFARYVAAAGGRGGAGRFFYPVVGEAAGHIEDEMGVVLLEAFSQAFPD